MNATNKTIRLLGALGGALMTLAMTLAIDGYARHASEIAALQAHVVRLEPVTVVGERPSAATAGRATAAADKRTKAL